MRHFAIPWMTIAAVLTAGCYRNLLQLECDAPNPPPYCSDATTSDAATGTVAVASTTGASETSETSETDTGVDTASASSGPDHQDTSTTEPVDATDTATDTGAEPSCGDGVVQKTEGEECDDGNLVTDDGCNHLCQRDRTIFLASAPGWRGGQLQGLKGADNYCVSRAGLAGLPNALLYKAFLSDSKTDAVDRLFHGLGRYTLLDGTPIAKDWQALLSEPLLHPIDLTELGEVAHVGVWTGTRYGDGRAVPGLNHCKDWTSDDYLEDQSNFGTSDEVDINWTQSQYSNPTNCAEPFAIYCIEQQ